jgi:hypothetical protein
MSNPIKRHKSYAVIRPPGAHSEPNIIDSIGLRLPQQRLCGPKCAVTLGRTTAVIWAKRNAPFYLRKINDLHIGAGRTGGHHSPPPGARAAARCHATLPLTRGRRPMISCSGKKFPCSRNRNPSFRLEQGIGCKLLNSLGDRLPKPRQEARIGRNFQNFPVISLFSGN